jgi:integrase
MQIQDHDDFPKLDHRPVPSRRKGQHRRSARRPTSRGSPREVDPHREPGDNSNGTSGEDHSGSNTIKRTFVRHAEDCDLPGFTPGTIRHFMATMVRREKPLVPKEQRDVWLGHNEKRTANAYEAFDPEYLRDRMQATESVIEKLQEHTTRPLFACKLRAKPELKVVAGGRR